MTPPGVPKVCRKCSHAVECYPPEDSIKASLRMPICAALELLKTVGTQSPADCRSEEMCLLAERLRKEVR